MKGANRGRAKAVSSSGNPPSAPSTTPPLRRSKRKLNSGKEVSTVFDTPPPSTKKVRKVKEVKNLSKADLPLKDPATLMTLNYDVQDKLLKYLDVQVVI